MKPLARERRLLFSILLCLWGTGAFAHALDPMVLAITGEEGVDEVVLSWRVSNVRYEAGSAPVVDGCRAFAPTVLRVPPSVIVRANIACPGGVTGRTVSLPTTVGPAVETFVNVTVGGASANMVLPAHEATFVVPAPGSGAQSGIDRLRAGITHLGKGLDHLLIVAAFALIYGFRLPLFVALAGFTLGHSVTLALVGMGLSRPPRATELLIALSVLFLAREASEQRRRGAAGDQLIHQHVWLASSVIGLCHGLGFATGFLELGLRDALIPTLLWFNLGLELGQLLAVLALFILAVAVGRLGLPTWTHARQLGAYLIGVAGAYWTVSRSVSLWAAMA